MLLPGRWPQALPSFSLCVVVLVHVVGEERAGSCGDPVAVWGVSVIV